ncbi:sensor histidine kinase [Aurantiacibacter gilvus]|uniref:histidine kinase n=1 Tax=Aurantiacibacter gilvus TaxID=3139141 RepID=A0ABU9II12_9SPHN
MPFNELPDDGAMPAPSADFADEAKRLDVLARFETETLEDDPELQAIVEFAARLCNAPVSIVTTLEKDRQRFLAKRGVDQRETPRDVAFCNYTLGTSELLEVPDAPADPRFADNPLVTDGPGVRYYAGQPLVSQEGASVGTLCVIDVEAHPEPLDEFQREGLAVLAQAAMRRLEARRNARHAKRIIAEREERLRRVLEGLPQVAWSADAAGNFDYFNRRWREMTGGEPPQLAEEWRPYIHPDDAEAAFAEWNRCFAKGEEFEVEFRMRRADGSWAWVLSLAVPVAEHAGDPVRWFGTVTDIDEVHRALDERDLLAKELAHRIKNIFAVVIGLASLKARKQPQHQPFAEELTQVLRALNRAHDFVRPQEGPVQESLKGLLEAMFAPYGETDGQPCVRVSGMDTPVGARAATPLALVFHEMATNSAKYGALSADGGYIELRIKDEDDAIALSWNEFGGPPVEDGGARGFGSRLVEMSVTGQLQGTFERHFVSSGLVAELTMAKAALTD